MSPGEQTSKGPTPIVFDTTVLSNFARSRSVDWLVRTIEVPVTAPAVGQELQRGRDEGYDYLQPVFDWLRHVDSLPADPENEICVLEPARRDSVPDAIVGLDHGESRAFRVAWPNWVVATDDRDARRVAEEYGVEITGSVGILADGVSRDELSKDTADEWLESWEKAGYRSPVDSVTELL